MRFSPIRALAAVGVLACCNAFSFAQQVPAPAQSPAAPSVNASPANLPNDYTLSGADLFTVVVYNHPELSGDFLIPDGGIVVFPLAGEIKVVGMTVSELSKELTKRLDMELIEPNVAVILKTPRIQQITVMGDVQKPGAMPIVTGERIADAISSAGGLLPDLKANDTLITVLGRGGSTTTVSMLRVLAGDPADNQVLRDGETITIDSGTFTVFVVGQVKTPGPQRMNRGAGLLEAIASAGGTTDTAAISKVHITTLAGQEQDIDLTPQLVHGEKIQLPLMHRGDVVTVPVNTRQVTVLGYVAVPGTFPIPEGLNLSLADAISLAKGHDLEKRASFSKVVVSRAVNGKSSETTYDLGKYFAKGDVTQNPTLKSGDVVFVPETHHADNRVVAQALAAVGAIIFYTSQIH